MLHASLNRDIPATAANLDVDFRTVESAATHVVPPLWQLVLGSEYVQSFGKILHKNECADLQGGKTDSHGTFPPDKQVHTASAMSQRLLPSAVSTPIA